MSTKGNSPSPKVKRQYRFDVIGSTNTFAKTIAPLPASGLIVIAANRQSAGRGQRENSFFSGPGGLYASIICPIANIGAHFACNRALTLAICDAVARAHPKAALSIKWPNDILWSDKKLCGILLENSPHSAAHLVAGFGVNVNIAAEEFPGDLRLSATSMLIETGRRFEIPVLLHDICERFELRLQAPPSEVHAIYHEKLYKLGSAASINGASGLFQGVLEDGRLCLNEKGVLNYFSSGPLQFID